MAYRRISTDIWQDPWFEALVPQRKMLFIYLITNKSCNQSGLYQTSSRRIAFETGIKHEHVEAEMDGLSPKVIRDGDWVWVKNFVKYQSQNPSFLKSAEEEASKAPPWMYQAWCNHCGVEYKGPPTTVPPQWCHSDTTYPSSVTDTESTPQWQHSVSGSKLPSVASLNGSPPYASIIAYLNEKTGKDFQHTTKDTRRYIKARWNQGFTEEHFRKVIDSKVSKWKDDEKFVDYLRPQTLFGSKFEAYLNEIPALTDHERLMRWANAEA